MSLVYNNVLGLLYVNYKRDCAFFRYMSFVYQIKVPKERIAVLIGKKGQVRKKIEDTMEVTLTINSKEGDVEIQGEEALQLYTTRDIIRAIARGFNPEVALLLLKQDYVFELIDVTKHVKENHIARIKGRIIGKGGKAREVIEELTGTYISVYGKSVAIIGEVDCVRACKRAIDSLVQGAPHSVVYKWLERRRREIKAGLHF
jgi:ribosomal RNA assembly protein